MNEQCKHPEHGKPWAAVCGDPCAVQEALDHQAAAWERERQDG